MGIIGFLILGLLAGAIAKAITTRGSEIPACRRWSSAGRPAVAAATRLPRSPFKATMAAVSPVEPQRLVGGVAGRRGVPGVCPSAADGGEGAFAVAG